MLNINQNHSARNLLFKKVTIGAKSLETFPLDDAKVATKALVEAKPELDKKTKDYDVYIVGTRIKKENFFGHIYHESNLAIAIKDPLFKDPDIVMVPISSVMFGIDCKSKSVINGVNEAIANLTRNRSLHQSTQKEEEEKNAAIVRLNKVYKG